MSKTGIVIIIATILLGCVILFQGANSLKKMRAAIRQSALLNSELSVLRASVSSAAKNIGVTDLQSEAHRKEHVMPKKKPGKKKPKPTGY